jgi:hypothetical protein
MNDIKILLDWVLNLKAPVWERDLKSLQARAKEVKEKLNDN